MLGNGHYLWQGAVEKGRGDIEFECKQLEGGGKISMQMQLQRRGNLSAQTSECHLRVTKNHH